MQDALCVLTSLYVMEEGAMSSHCAGTHYMAMLKATSIFWTLIHLVRDNGAIEAEAEARWTMFTAKHNLPFITSDHRLCCYC